MCGLGSVQLYSILTKNLFMIKLWPAIFAGAPQKIRRREKWLWHKSEVSDLCRPEKNTEQTYLILTNYLVTADKGIDV